MSTCLLCRERPATARGLCARCYSSARRAGTLEDVALPSKAGTRRATHAAGDRRIDSDGYVRIWDGDRWIAEHRIVMERMLGRALAAGEQVRHRNGERADNDPTNLELLAAPRPGGQPVDQMIAYVVTHHRDAVRAALAQTGGLEPNDDDVDRTRVAELLRAVVERTGLSQRQLSERLDVSQPYISQMLNRRRAVPATVLVAALTLAGVDLDGAVLRSRPMKRTKPT